MSSLQTIIAPIESDFDAFKLLIGSTVASNHKMLGPIANYILTSKGKMMRPILGLLTAKLHAQTISNRTMSAAMLFELLHHATLIHDDVIDEAYTRRGELTAGALLRSRAGVLAGDFLFAVGLRQAAVSGAFTEIEIATQAIENVVEGELRQSENARRLVVDLEEYYSVIDLKTGALIAGVAAAGAIGAGAEKSECEKMAKFGSLVGRAFQVQDDILDYTGKESGKSLYNDIKERKITLPLIAAIDKLGSKTEVLNKLKNGKIDFVVDYVKQGGGIEAARGVMDSICGDAVALLDNYANSPIKESLKAFATYAIYRNK